MLSCCCGQAFAKLEKPKPDAALETDEQKDKFYDKWCAVRFPAPPPLPPALFIQIQLCPGISCGGGKDTCAEFIPLVFLF